MSEVTRERIGKLEVGVDDDGDILIFHPAFGDEAMSLAPEHALQLGIALLKVCRIVMGPNREMQA